MQKGFDRTPLSVFSDRLVLLRQEKWMSEASFLKDAFIRPPDQSDTRKQCVTDNVWLMPVCRRHSQQQAANFEMRVQVK